MRASDGQAYNWTIQQRWFSSFTAIVDFIHVVECLYEAAKALRDDSAARWAQYVEWANTCWQGNVAQVLEQLQSFLAAMAVDAAAAVSDPRKAVERSATYLANNPRAWTNRRYRREGLLVTSSLAESLVKQVGKRAKGTEKFWDDGASGEAILQIRAAVISQDNRLGRFLHERPILPLLPTL
jgi:hypothetical protein